MGERCFHAPGSQFPHAISHLVEVPAMALRHSRSQAFGAPCPLWFTVGIPEAQALLSGTRESQMVIAKQSGVTITVNGQSHAVQAEAYTPLLYVLRNELKLNAPKFGCGLGQC